VCALVGPALGDGLHLTGWYAAACTATEVSSLRRLAASLSVLVWTLAVPAMAFAQETELDKPEGTDHTLTTIFVVSLGIPLLLLVLTLIDIALGRHDTDAEH